MADEIVIEPKDPVNPAGKPGVGGLAAIPSLIGAIVGADDFCSVWNFPFSGACIADPNDPERHAIPAWCLAWSDGPYCNKEAVDEPVVINKNICFDSAYNVIPCVTKEGVSMCTNVPDYIKIGTSWNVGPGYETQIPCNDLISCLDVNGVSINCNIVYNPMKGNHFYVHNGQCMTGAYGALPDRPTSFMPCKTEYQVKGTVSGTGDGVSFDQYMRRVNTSTGIPVTNDDYEGGYPMTLLYPVEPEPDEGSTPEIPIPTESCGVICDWLQLIHGLLFSIDTQLIAFLDYMEQVITSIQPVPFPEFPVFDTGLDDELTAILEAIDNISVEMVKEAGTNFWDVLGGAFGDIFDFVEFLIEKVIYLVIPEDSSAIVNAFDLLRADLMGKVSPIHEIQQHITKSIPNEQKEFVNLAITLPRYGEVTFFKTDYLLLAIPFIRQLLSAIMVILTAIWAYRKVSSEMIK